MIQTIIDYIVKLVPFIALAVSAYGMYATSKEKARQARDEKVLTKAQADDIYSQINQRIQEQYENLVTSLNASIEDLQRQSKIKDHQIDALQDQVFMMRESFRKDLQLYKKYINYMLKFIEDHVSDGCVPLDLEHFNSDGTAEFSPTKGA